MLSRRGFGLVVGAGAMAIASTATAQASPVSFNVIYPNHPGAKFDTAYYKASHIPLVMRVMGATRVTLIEGVARGATPAPYLMIAHFEFASQAALDAGLAKPEMTALRADVAKFTDISPTTMFGKPL